MNLDELKEKWQDVLDVAYSEDDWLTINLVEEFLDDLRH